MYHFEVSLFARPTDLEFNSPVELRGVSLTPIDPTALTAGKLFTCTFEETATKLAALFSMDIEPDGYFVWARGIDADRWQVDGHLFDRNNKLWRVDLKGSCPKENFEELLSCIDAPTDQIVFQLVQEGITLEEANFLTWASTSPSI